MLVGPSGCGKSTALRMIAGLEAITGGVLTIGGVVANGLSPRQRNVAMIFQSYALYPHLTVAENLGFALKVRKEPGAASSARWRNRGDAGTHGAAQRRPGQLSGGQRQRVAMGRALVRDPNAFLMDEPLSNLDARLRGQMRVEIARLQRAAGVTTVYVTHDQVEAMTMGDQVAVMRGGVFSNGDRRGRSTISPSICLSPPSWAPRRSACWPARCARRDGVRWSFLGARWLLGERPTFAPATLTGRSSSACAPRRRLVAESGKGDLGVVCISGRSRRERCHNRRWVAPGATAAIVEDLRESDIPQYRAPEGESSPERRGMRAGRRSASRSTPSACFSSIRSPSWPWPSCVR